MIEMKMISVHYYYTFIAINNSILEISLFMGQCSLKLNDVINYVIFENEFLR